MYLSNLQFLIHGRELICRWFGHGFCALKDRMEIERTGGCTQLYDAIDLIAQIQQNDAYPWIRA